MGNHILLTGATGLLGRYLLRDMLVAGIPVAALVRPNSRQSVEERIESLMATWEGKLERKLPRPYVLEGDVCRENLGLDVIGMQWVEDNCDSLLHNAASLSFQSTDDKESEPWRSNLGGTEKVLDLCRQTGIQDYHHVSTAYVCGLRSGRVLEDELDEGQLFGNDYERSKVQAEQLVRSADFLSSTTFYRPSIIIGDSQTGFTTTFHGFYAALRLVYTLARAVAEGELGKDGVPTRRLTLNGTERKNFVPVDWVSAAIKSILEKPEHYGKTYHLTPPSPVTISQVKDTLEEANDFEGAEFVGEIELDNPNEVEQMFYEHMKVYNSYWRDDPEFDRSNVLEALPDLPCPDVDQAMLMHLSQVAIDMDFRWKDVPVRKASWIDA